MNIFKKAVAFILLTVMTLSLVSVNSNALSDDCVSSKTVADDMFYLQIDGVEYYDYANEVFELINQLRRSLGLNELVLDKTLMDVAMERAAEISVYYSHTRPSGEGCFTALPDSFIYYSAGENIAIGYVSPEHVMEGWTNSSGHYANMINVSFASVGVGCFKTEEGYYGWVQFFSGKKGEASDKTGRSNAQYSILTKRSNLGVTVTIEKDLHNAKKGETTKIGITNCNVGFPYWLETINSDSFIYKSGNENALTISADGVITVVGEGESKIEIVDKVTGNVFYSYTLAVGHIYLNECDSTCEYCDKKRAISHSFTLNDGRICEHCGFDKLLDLILGDLDENFSVDTTDLATMKLYLAGLNELEQKQLSAGDLNSDGEVNTTDLAILKLNLAGL